MNWDDVRFFLALCREGSVTQAGKALDVNHTTVARRIAALEDSLGARLFDRTRDGYAMTQAAENMYDQALEMEAYARAIDRAMAGQDAQLKGSLKLTAPYDFANRVLVPALPRFRERYPCIDIELLTTTDLVDLSAREADIAVRLTAKPPDYLVGRRILPLVHGIYGSRDYLAAPPEPPGIIVFRSQKTLPEWTERRYATAQIVLKTDNLTTMCTAVESGLGLARLPCFEADNIPGLRRLDEPLSPSTWGVWILSHVDLRSTARVRVCREFLASVILEKRDLILGETSRYAD